MAHSATTRRGLKPAAAAVAVMAVVLTLPGCSSSAPATPTPMPAPTSGSERPGGRTPPPSESGAARPSDLAVVDASTLSGRIDYLESRVEGYSPMSNQVTVIWHSQGCDDGHRIVVRATDRAVVVGVTATIFEPARVNACPPSAWTYAQTITFDGLLAGRSMSTAPATVIY